MKGKPKVEDDDILQTVRNGLSKLVAISDEAWQAFADRARIKHLKKKEHFLTNGEVCHLLGIIYQGYVRHYYIVDGKQITNDFNFEGMVTGAYHSFINQTAARFNVVAMQDTTLVTFGKDHWLSLLEHYPEWQKISRILLERIFHRKQRREESFLLDSPEQRYLAILENTPHMIRRVPLQYIASYLGITSETLSRIRASVRNDSRR